MRKESVLGLAGLFLTGVLGCETNRPYCSRCLVARNNGQTETAYRPKTVVTMRADEVPENPAPAQACPAIQLVSAPSTNVAMASGQAAGSTQTVTVTIPAMKIVVPVTAAVTAPPTAIKENSNLTELPPTVGSMVQASGTASISSSSTNPKSKDGDLHPVAHVQKEEMAGAASTAPASPPLPEAVPEPKPKSKSSANSSDPARSSRLSRLPDEPPPEFSARHSVPAIAPTRFLDMPPPPPPIPKPSPVSGPTLPSEEAAPQ
jgi:hypothetical protein